MKETVNSWMEQAWTALECIPAASEVVGGQRTRWNEFQCSDKLEVVLFGAYDAGKSSLLKRLLVDWKIPVPDWLTVSGRRETFEFNRAEAADLGLTDTPGLGSGNSEHDEVTQGAMRLADAYLWVLPPQLVTTGKERLLDIIFGDVGIAEVTIAVVARMDEAGIDPSDNEVGFTDLCSKKMNELLSLIPAGSPTRELRSVHCIVADPYQMVGNTPNPDIALYDVGRSWDGVAGLAEQILAMKEQRIELRAQAGARFVRLLLSDVLDELTRLSEELALSKEGMDNEASRHALYEQRLDALERQARAQLHRQIEDALLSVSRSSSAGAESIQSLEETLSKVVDEWADGAFADFSQLAGEIELEVRERMAGPSMSGFRRLAQDAEEHEEHEAKAEGTKMDPLKTGRKALAFGPALRKSFELYAAKDLGMSLKDAAEGLKKLESPEKTVEDVIKSLGRDAPFRSAEHAKKASQFVKWANVAEAVGPLVEQLGGALFEIAGEVMTAKRAEERAQQRLELRRQLRTEAEKLEETAAAGFETTCEGFRRWTKERLAKINTSRESLSEHTKHIQESMDSIQGLIATYPCSRARTMDD